MSTSDPGVVVNTVRDERAAEKTVPVPNAGRGQDDRFAKGTVVAADTREKGADEVAPSKPAAGSK
ncbi:MAG: hypothetical protein AUH77_08485 [Candidatus Rokubacteria bacterium 13_1_40CM_4_69_39]|nr:MAG: hypothetical protein AUH77_08485 [Candidatus Rokubacteria bacterium 13_1_40CM_4_69_39]